MRLKFMTYNICHGKDFSKAVDEDVVNIVKLDQIANIINKYNPDVVGLNEVYDKGELPEYENQAKKIAEMAGYKYYKFAEGFDYEWCNIGNAILSKYPIVKCEEYHIPTLPENEREEDTWYEPRVLLVCDLNVDGQIVRVIPTHFGLVDFELKSIVKKSSEIIDNTTTPMVLMGDFNVRPNDERLQPLYDRLKSVSKEVGDNTLTFASYNTYTLIDYFFVSKTAKIISYGVHDERASDHRPLTCEIEF